MSQNPEEADRALMSSNAAAVADHGVSTWQRRERR